MTNGQSFQEKLRLSRRERNVSIAFFGLVALLTMFDVFEDFEEGAHLTHIIPEIFTALVALAAAVILFYRFAVDRAESLSEVEDQVGTERKVAQEWRDLAVSYQKGISAAIIKQFELWNLTPAEQDVCLFLLKGFSIQEIATLRSTSERTVRQQASVIYRKSDLSGRAQLSAFFLEDLLGPDQIISG